MDRPNALRAPGESPAYAGWDGRLTLASLAYFFYGWPFVEANVSFLAGLVLALTFVAALAGSLASDYLAPA
jgi:energy-converting hydrogenase Eha subunit B